MFEKHARPTLTPVELNHGETLRFVLRNGARTDITLRNTGWEVVSSTLMDPAALLAAPPKAVGNEHVGREGAITVYRFFCELEINGRPHVLEREVPSQKSFYEPWVIDGTRIWFDAISSMFQSDGGFLLEKDAAHGVPCRPLKKARFALQDATLDICPEPLHPWLPPEYGVVKIENCYRGEDCWMGTYNGIHAHGGLDINHPAGTPLYVPVDLDDQFYFNSLATGANNNRWRGIRRWDDGSEWIIQAHHMTALTVPEHTPLKRGTQFALGGGVLSGYADHSHFVFRIAEGGASWFLDPWILFWRMSNP